MICWLSLVLGLLFNFCWTSLLVGYAQLGETEEDLFHCDLLVGRIVIYLFVNLCAYEQNNCPMMTLNNMHKVVGDSSC